MRLSPRTTRTIASPIGEAYALLERRSNQRELLDLAQAAPRYPPAPEVVEHVIAVARQRDAGDYVEIAGLPRLRTAFAAELSDVYRGTVQEENVLVTAGCNQAFCMVTSALAEPGTEIILALPYYFNHDMWLRLYGIAPVYLEPGPYQMPSAPVAETLITPRTRAIVLVSPGNPTGLTIAPEVIAEFAGLARSHELALVLDETYRSFRDSDQPAHALFADPDWPETLVSLHSFSKELAIPGYRVGAVVASAQLNREVTKLLDCVAICAPRLGQEAAWAGLTAAGQWRRERVAELAEKRRWFEAVMAARPGGFELISAGGFFGWLRHPFAGRSTDEVVEDLAIRYDTLVIPGTAFLPEDRGTFRVSLSNVDLDALTEFADRLDAAGRQEAAGQ